MDDALLKALMPLTLVASAPQKPFVGPPRPRAPEVRQLQGRMEEPDESLMKALWPIMAAKALDLVSTEVALSKPNMVERNPMPGMGTTAGRIGINLAEMLAIGLASRGRPKVQSLANTLYPAYHGTLAGQNMAFAQGDNFDLLNRSR